MVGAAGQGNEWLRCADAGRATVCRFWILDAEGFIDAKADGNLSRGS